MKLKRYRIHPFYSLRTQLLLGSIALLVVTVASISLPLVLHQTRVLRNEIEKSVIFQGRNIGLGIEQPLIKSDPEFELFELVRRLLAERSNIVSVLITDGAGEVQADRELHKLGTMFELDVSHYEVVSSPHLAAKEALLKTDDVYLFRGAVQNVDKTIGFVYLTYSKEELGASIQHAFWITFIFSGIALWFGIMVSLLLFRRISNPMDVLMAGVNKLGQGELGIAIDLDTKSEFRVLAQSFNQMAKRISRDQEKLIVKERMDRELEIARDIQSTLIPKNVQEPTGYEIGMHYKSATEVGGDYLDVILTDSGQLALVIADVSGKGVPGLVVMAMLKVMVRELAKTDVPPKEVIRRLNATLADNIHPKMFVTFFIAYLDLSTGELVGSNAGHNPSLVYNHERRSSEWHRITGSPLGILDDKDIVKTLDEFRVNMRAGDVFLQYTDGLNESRDIAGNQFSFKRVLSLTDKHASLGAKGLVDRLVDEEERFRSDTEPTDDITLLAVSAALPVPARHHATRH